MNVPREPDVVGPEVRYQPVDKPAWWWWKFPPHINEWDLVIRDPHGHLGILSWKAHKIAADGTVSPSVWFKGLCGQMKEWHETGVRLLEWDTASVRRRLSGVSVPT